ncbi:MAG: 2-oxoacid:acceptor oxidoreductase family protein [Clostridiales bacterium]|nr:2-oxoacid:acceptor oxidoreductase family protein [Clostridiales bacterium]
MTKRTEIRLSGSGGQGLILAGIILADAAISEDKNAVQSQSYGPEARGGASKAEVIIDSNEIDFPKVGKADLLLVLTKESYTKYISSLKTNGTLIIDSAIDIDCGKSSFKIVKLPITDTAINRVGKSIVANIVALGAIQEITGIVDKSSLEEAVLKRVPKAMIGLNKKALEEGYNLAVKTS